MTETEYLEHGKAGFLKLAKDYGLNKKTKKYGELMCVYAQGFLDAGCASGVLNQDAVGRLSFLAMCGRLGMVFGDDK